MAAKVAKVEEFSKKEYQDRRKDRRIFIFGTNLSHKII